VQKNKLFLPGFTVSSRPMTLEQIPSFDTDNREARKHAERLLVERSRCYERIRSIDSKLMRLSTRYGFHLDMDENLIVSQ